MTTSQLPAGANATNVVAEWEDASRVSPAPRHRRRLIRNIVAGLDDVSDCLDAGCGHPFLVSELEARLGLAAHGCDVSDTVIEASQASLGADRFEVVDLERGRWPGDRQFDLVISSEVLEHLVEWRAALANVAAMSRRWLLITVPGGKVRDMDRIVGHHRHFTGEQIAAAMREEGFEIRLSRRWGVPFHSMYRAALSRLGADRMYESFGTAHYGWFQRTVSSALYALFFANDPFRRGDQVIVLGRRP